MNANITALEQRGIEPYIATGREAHHIDLNTLLGKLPDAPAASASPKEKMAYKLATEIGQAIYRLRKCTVEPVIGIIKEILGFRQFSLRGLAKVTGEWCLPQVSGFQSQAHACLDAWIGYASTRRLPEKWSNYQHETRHFALHRHNSPTKMLSISALDCENTILSDNLLDSIFIASMQAGIVVPKQVEVKG